MSPPSLPSHDNDIEAHWEIPENSDSDEDENETSECDVRRESEGKEKRNTMMQEVVAEEGDY